jgi:hypothetical protein
MCTAERASKGRREMSAKAAAVLFKDSVVERGMLPSRSTTEMIEARTEGVVRANILLTNLPFDSMRRQ